LFFRASLFLAKDNLLLEKDKQIKLLEENKQLKQAEANQTSF
jgi:hypothetical protein